MPATITSITPRRSTGPASARRPNRAARFATTRASSSAASPSLIVLVALVAPANRTPYFSADFLAELLLYALSAAGLTMLVALLFVLARNIIKLIVERRRALPFARFRAKLVALLLGMTLVPATLVLIVGSELIRTNIDRWFNAPMDEILSSANQIASDYYQQRQAVLSDHATRIARALASSDLAAADVRPIRDLLAPSHRASRADARDLSRRAAERIAADPRSGGGRRAPQPPPAPAAPPSIDWPRRRSATGPKRGRSKHSAVRATCSMRPGSSDRPMDARGA